MTITDPRFARETNRVPQLIDYEERPVLSSTIHPDIKNTLVAISKRTGGVSVRSQMRCYTPA